jgi:hypothetical protein
MFIKENVQSILLCLTVDFWLELVRDSIHEKDFSKSKIQLVAEENKFYQLFFTECKRADWI